MKEKPQKHELEVRVYITNVTLHVWQSKEKPTSTQSQCLKEKKKKKSNTRWEMTIPSIVF